MGNRAVTSLNSRRRDDDCEGCHYCGLRFGSVHHEHDHAPIPKHVGGVDEVPACVTCHDLKDRAGLNGWPATDTLQALSRLAESGLLAAALLGAPPQSWPVEWSEMGRWERLLWARAVKLAHMDSPPDDLLWMTLHAS